jgi:hypothetical protein
MRIWFKENKNDIPKSIWIDQKDIDKYYNLDMCVKEQIGYVYEWWC